MPNPQPPHPKVLAARWQKGQSGNPSGRPKKAASLAEQVRTAMRGQHRERIIKRVIKLAEGGNLEATKLLWTYAYGPPPREPLVALQQNFGGDRNPKVDLGRLSVPELLQLASLLEKAEGVAVQEVRPLPSPVLDLQPEPQEPAVEEAVVEAEPETNNVSPLAPVDRPQPGFDPKDPDLKENQASDEESSDLWRPSPWRK